MFVSKKKLEEIDNAIDRLRARDHEIVYGSPLGEGLIDLQVKIRLLRDDIEVGENTARTIRAQMEQLAEIIGYKLATNKTAAQDEVWVRLDD